MLPRRAGWFALAVLLGPLPGSSQVPRQPPTAPVPRTFFIRGSVRDNDTGRPLEMIRVELRTMTGQSIATAFSRSNGEFEFYGLPNGIYAIIVEERDFEPVRENVEIFNVGRSGLFVFLKKASETNLREPGSTVSVRELKIPGRARDAMRKGRQRLHEKKDFQGSLPHFQRAVAEFPEYYEAYFEMGLAYLRLEQSAAAEEVLRKSIELSQGRYAEAHFLLASVLSNQEKYQEAEVFARRGLDLHGNAWQGHFEIARAQFGLNQLDSAEKNALEARTGNPNFGPIHLLLANLHIRRRDYPALLEDLDTYLKLEPTGPMSDQARQMRDKIQQNLAKAPGAPPSPPPKP